MFISFHYSGLVTCSLQIPLQEDRKAAQIRRNYLVSDEVSWRDVSSQRSCNEKWCRVYIARWGPWSVRCDRSRGQPALIGARTKHDSKAEIGHHTQYFFDPGVLHVRNVFFRLFLVREIVIVCTGSEHIKARSILPGAWSNPDIFRVRNTLKSICMCRKPHVPEETLPSLLEVLCQLLFEMGRVRVHQFEKVPGVK